MMTRILLVDDDANVRSILSTTLRISGYEVVEATNGADGVKRFRERPTDVVLCDLLMPVTNGLELIRVFGLDFPAIPVIAMSGSRQQGDTDVLALAMVMGAASILEKPFSLPVLLATIEKVLQWTATRPLRENCDSEWDDLFCQELLAPPLPLG
jgi:CheY-like chemotaxis protein